MILTAKQQEALKIAVDRYNLGEKFTVISGYAGSGKSTVVRFIIDALQVNPQQDVSYVAFTGKAAKVLAQKGCPNAITAHKLLYMARPTPDGGYIYTPKPMIDTPIVVVDEISMLPKKMWDLLLTHQVYVIACGDPGQLPPINPDDDNHVLEHPHVFLDEIMRQAQESEIIRLSMHVREGGSLSDFVCAGTEVQIIDASQVVEGMYTWADQVLCATNNRRNEVNQILRKIKGFGPEPCVGDKVISLRNHWDDLSFPSGNPLTNGTIGYLEEYAKTSLWVPSFIYKDNDIPVARITMRAENDDEFCVTADYKCLATGEKTLDPKQEYIMNKNKRYPNAPYEFVYGYGITTWKAQGSEWDKVLAFEEDFPYDKETHQKFLYTTITRAKNKLVLVKK